MRRTSSVTVSPERPPILKRPFASVEAPSVVAETMTCTAATGADVPADTTVPLTEPVCAAAVSENESEARTATTATAILRDRGPARPRCGFGESDRDARGMTHSSSGGNGGEAAGAVFRWPRKWERVRGRASAMLGRRFCLCSTLSFSCGLFLAKLLDDDRATPIEVPTSASDR